MKFLLRVEYGQINISNHDNHKYSLHSAFPICASRGVDILKMYGDITR